MTSNVFRSPTAPRWLLLTHQLPPRPAYQRVKIWRRLQSIGAVGVKKSVYALPFSDDALEDFLWTAKEIEAAGGEALVCEARLLQGMNDDQLRALFDVAREADYVELAKEARERLKPLGKRAPMASDIAAAETAARRLRRRFAAIVEIDYFGANAREATDALIRDLESRILALAMPQTVSPQPKAAEKHRDMKGKTWVTRRGVKIDRVACAWLIRRFIDPKAMFRFVDPSDYRPGRDELRFDMASAEFTHRGDRCSFEVLLEEVSLKDPALVAIGEIVHDLDLKDEKFGRPEADGVRHVVAGLVLATDDDDSRIRQASDLFDNLYRSFQQRPARK